MHANQSNTNAPAELQHALSQAKQEPSERNLQDILAGNEQTIRQLWDACEASIRWHKQNALRFEDEQMPIGTQFCLEYAMRYENIQLALLPFVKLAS